MNPFNDVPISYNKKQNKRTLYNWPLHEYRFCMRECVPIYVTKLEMKATKLEMKART